MNGSLGYCCAAFIPITDWSRPKSADTSCKSPANDGAERCSVPRSNLYAVKIAARSIIFINFTVNDLFRQFSLSLPGFLCLLQFESVLVHWESHGLIDKLANTDAGLVYDLP